jgi:beta-fructofuranosidase
MKNKIIILFILLSCCCCDKPDLPKEEPTIDITLDRRSPSDAEASYKTFYKPSNGETGDPMPYYNEADQTFYVYFLLEIHSTYSKGGIYLTKTKDFATFDQIPKAAVLVGNVGDRDEAIGTGTCIKKDNKYHFFYTGFGNPAVWNNYTQAAVKATSNAPDFSNQTKHLANYLKAPSGLHQDAFRDPNVYFDPIRNKYVQAVESQKWINDQWLPVLVRFQSDDLTNWEPIENITAVRSENGISEHEIFTDAQMMECPDIFQMGGKWYMVFSRLDADIHRKTFYRIADSPEGPWRKCNGHETFDGLYLYAAKTVFDGTTRYVSGWASSGQQFNQGGELDWGGMLITHKLVQQADGKLYPAIPDAVDAKFSAITEYKDIKTDGIVSGSGDSFTISGGKVIFNRNVSSCKIEMKINATAATKGFGVAFGAYENQQDAYRFTFDMTGDSPVLCMKPPTGEIFNFTPLIVPANKIFDVKIVIEKTVAVMYVNGNVAFTHHISNMEQNPWMIFADEGTVTFSDIKIYKQ